MAIKKVKLPNNTVVDINDARNVPVVDTNGVLNSAGFINTPGGGGLTYAIGSDNATGGQIEDLVLATTDNLNGMLKVDSGGYFDDSNNIRGFNAVNGAVVALPGCEDGTEDYTLATTDDLGSYLPLSGGTMTGDIVMTNGEYINAPNGYAMLGQNGSGTFYCGPGYAVSSSFLIRSGNINLTHRKHTANNTYTDYKIYDASNITISSSAPTSSQGENGDIWIVI